MHPRTPLLQPLLFVCGLLASVAPPAWAQPPEADDSLATAPARLVEVAPARADSLAALDDPPAVRPLLLVTSGGVSKGAYQAGVSWAVLTLLKEAGRPGIAVQPHDLVVTTGASAGSANTLLSVAEWARPRAGLESPRTSPYWHFWTSLGLSEVIPPCRTCDPARLDVESALSRRAIEEALIPEMLDYLAGPDLALRRPIAMGYMLTTRAPLSVDVSSGLTVPSLRAAMSARATPVRGPRGESLGVSFESVNYRLPEEVGPCPGGARPYPEMGPVVHAPLAPLARTPEGEAARVCDPGARPSPGLADRAVGNREAMARGALASAAFPYAWAPVSLTLAVGLDARGFPSEALAPPREYLDGGVFDNNPLSLAIQLAHRAEGDPDACAPDAPALDWSRPTILFVDPDARRPLQPTVLPPDGTPGEHNRLADFLGLVNQFMESGRAYEIESESRDLAPAYVEGLRATSRAFPILGSELFSFGTFLARPFRLYDFYVGVYDGYVYAVQKLAEAPAPDAAAEGDAVLALYDASGLVEADPLADVVFRELLQSEYPTTRDRVAQRPTPEARGADPSWARVLRAHVETAVAHRASSSWFGPLAARLTSDPEIVRILEAWSDSCAADVARALAEEGASRPSRLFVRGRACDASPHLLPILREPSRRLLGVGAEILTHRVSAEGGGGGVGVSLALAAMNVYLATHRPGLQVNRSVLPDFGDGLYGAADYRRSDRLRRWLVRGLLPSRMVLSNGPFFATASVSWKAGPGHLVAEVAPVRQDRVVRDDDLTVLSSSGHLGFDLPIANGAAGLGARVALLRPLRGDGAGVGVEAFARVAHFLSVGVVATPWGRAWRDENGLETRYTRQAYLSATLHDVGGLAYWLSRLVAG